MSNKTTLQNKVKIDKNIVLLFLLQILKNGKAKGLFELYALSSILSTKK